MMPVVTVETWPMDREKKPELIRKITDIFVGFGVPAEGVTVIIHENHQDDWGTGGEQHSQRFRDIIRVMKK